MAQVLTFILAGTETTANSLTFAVYLLSQHPEAEQKLLNEVDAFGKDKPITVDDLVQVRNSETEDETETSSPVASTWTRICLVVMWALLSRHASCMPSHTSL